MLIAHTIIGLGIAQRQAKERQESETPRIAKEDVGRGTKGFAYV